MRLWFCALFLLACSSAPPVVAKPAPSAPQAAARTSSEVAPESQGHSRAPSPSERRLIDELMRDTEQIRELHFRQPVEVRIQDRAAMRAYVSRAIEEEDLMRTRRRYVALGLLDPALDVRELVESLMEEELVGYYDPKERALAVRDDVARSLGRKASDGELEWRATVVHELVHALQDQHLGLGLSMEKERTTDEDDAFGALVEGDATLAMLGYVAGKVGVPMPTLVKDPGRLAESLNATPERLTGALRSAPAIVREPLLFRYRAGAVFSANLVAQGGWEAVNAAHQALPPDTLSILEPRRYRTGAPPPLALFDLGWLHGLGYKSVDEDVLGSFELGVAVGPGPLGGLVTRAWRGDRYAVLEHQSGDASIWCLRFSTPATARKAERALAEMEDLGGGDGRRVTREGALLFVTRGLPEPTASQAIERFRAWARGAH
jgi:hypothetical protein